MRVGQLFGIEIKIDASWAVIVVLVAWSFWGRFTMIEGESPGLALVMAVSAAVLFFGSVLAHELAHSLEARRRGVEVRGITLFLFGGATETTFDVRRPVDELVLTAVGPFTSFALAAGFGLAATGAEAAGWGGVAAVAGLIGWLNLALGVFNLLPGAPLDGGRILRAIVWWVTHDRERALRVAARAGQVVGGLIIALGVLQILAVRGAFIGGLWFVFIGWFLMRAAVAELAQDVMRRLLEDVPVRRLVSRTPPIPAHVSVGEAVEDWFRAHDETVFPVVRGDEPVGVLGIDEVRSVPADDRSSVPVGEAMRPADDVPSLPADRSAGEFLERLMTEPVVLVVEDGRLVGLVTPERLAAFVRRCQQLEEARA